MIYSLNGTVISLTNNKGINCFQDRNPETQEHFKSEEDVLNWACKAAEEMTESKPMTITMTLEDTDGNAIEKIEPNKEFYINLKSSVETLSGNINTTLVTPEEEISLDFIFTNGESSRIMIISAPKIDYLQFNDILIAGEERYHVLHEKEHYKIIVE